MCESTRRGTWDVLSTRALVSSFCDDADPLPELNHRPALEPEHPEPLNIAPKSTRVTDRMVPAQRHLGH